MAELATTSAATSSPTPSGPPTTPPAPAPQPPAAPRLGVIADAAYDQLEPADRDRFARVRKGPDGGSEWIARDQLDKEPAAPGTAPAPGEKYKVGSFEITESEIADLMKTKAADEIRRNTLPKSVDEYSMDLPKDFKLPQGMQWEWKTDAPEFGKFKEIALKHGLTQEAVTDLAGIYAEKQVGETAWYEAMKKADMEKLGANVTTRVTALQTWFNGMLGPELGKAAGMGLYSSGMVRAMETLASKFANHCAASFSQSGREPASAPGRASEAEYAAMSQAERYAYAKSFDQKQFRN